MLFYIKITMYLLHKFIKMKWHKKNKKIVIEEYV